MNGASIARKTSFLREKMGAKLFADGIRIIDDPHRVRGLRSHPFDGEGVGGKRMALVEDGVLMSWILDRSTARELGLITTGHASRGVSSSPSPSASNLHLEAGVVTPAELIGDIKDGFYVTDLIGSGVNHGHRRTSSRGASGFWIENGEAHLCGERGHHRRPSRRYFPQHDAGQRPDLQTWYQRPPL